MASDRREEMGWPAVDGDYDWTSALTSATRSRLRAIHRETRICPCAIQGRTAFAHLWRHTTGRRWCLECYSLSQDWESDSGASFQIRLRVLYSCPDIRHYGACPFRGLGWTLRQMR